MAKLYNVLGFHYLTAVFNNFNMVSQHITFSYYENVDIENLNCIYNKPPAGVFNVHKYFTKWATCMIIC